MPYDFAILTAIHPKKRSLLGEVEFIGAFSHAREALVRSPEVDDDRTVSWGNVTLDEALRLADFQELPEDRAALRSSVSQLFANAQGAAFSIYLCDPYRGN